MGEFRTCKYCLKVKPATIQYWNMRRLKNGGITICDGACKICKNKRRVQLLNADPSKKRLKANMSDKKWKLFSEKRKLRQARFKNNNPGRTAEINFKYWKSQRENLGDSYLKYLIVRDTGLSHDDIPSQLVEIKRKQLKLHRYVSEKQATNH